MPNVWLSSDHHFNHDKEFIWKVRGFSSVQDMNENIIAKHNELVSPEDTVYLLGDLILGLDRESGLSLISRLNGNKIIIRGNHDTSARVEAYRSLNIPVEDALRITYKDYNFFLCHYPTLTANFESHIKACVINIYGHTHQEKSNFYNEIPWMYHIGLDSHNCYPVLIDDAIKEIHEKVKECKCFL